LTRLRARRHPVRWNAASHENGRNCGPEIRAVTDHMFPKGRKGFVAAGFDAHDDHAMLRRAWPSLSALHGK
jgi:hypothetical protein